MLELNDSRNVSRCFFALVRRCKPKIVLFENVAALLRKSFAPYFDLRRNAASRSSVHSQGKKN